MGESSILGALLDRIRRRTIAQLILDQGTLAASAGLGGLVALLFAGTQILNWYWPLALLGVVFLVGLFRFRGSIPTRYQVAQRADTRLGFSDSLSTAVYFIENGKRKRADPEIVLAQRNAAESLAASTGPEADPPFRAPRYTWTAAALAALSLGLIIARYGFRGELDISQPLVRIPFDTFQSVPDVAAKAKQTPKYKLPEGMEGFTVPPDSFEDQSGDPKPAPDEETLSQTLQADPMAARSTDGMKKLTGNEEAGQEPGEGSEKGDGSSAGDDRGQKDSGASSSGPKNAKSPSQGADQNSSPQNSDNSSLMDKMRDAMANMLARLRMTPRPGESSRQSMSSNQGAAQSASAEKSLGKKGPPSPGKQGDGQANSDEAGEQQGEGASKNMNAQGKMSDSAGDKQAQQEGKSGAGKQEGDKDIKQAEQQAAMGKISELLGKRAQNMSGEILVEVSSGKQQLKTQLTEKNASHSDTGGEISRDEVPAAYQHFVQQYFEQVRKVPSGDVKPKPAETVK